MERRIFFFLLEAEDEFLVQVDSIEKRKKEISCEIFDSFKLKQIQWIIRGGDGLTFVQGDSSFSFSLTALSLSLSLSPSLPLSLLDEEEVFLRSNWTRRTMYSRFKFRLDLLSDVRFHFLWRNDSLSRVLIEPTRTNSIRLPLNTAFKIAVYWN